jgi:8-amino-7-oxononanoate synthase
MKRGAEKSAEVVIAKEEIAPLISVPGTRTRLLGGKSYTDFIAGDLLGLSDSVSKKRELHAELESGGIFSSLSLTQGGASASTAIAMRRGALFFGVDRCLLFPSRNQAYWSLGAGLFREGDTVFIEEGHHSALLDIAELLHVRLITFRIEEPNALRERIEALQHQRSYVFLETIRAFDFYALQKGGFDFLDGLPESRLILDESLAFSILGVRGAGVFDGLPLPRWFACIVDCSHAFGLPVSMLLGSDALIQSLLRDSNFVRYEPALSGVISHALTLLLDACELSLDRRDLLLRKSQKFFLELPARVQKYVSLEYPCLAIPFSSLTLARQFQSALRSRYILCDVRPSPFIRSSAATVRLRIAANHSSADLEKLLESLEEIFKRGEFLS